MTTTQSYATGAWGPNKSFSEAGSAALYENLSSTHRSFETRCGSFDHFKLTRYLLRATADGGYGDSMERVIYNTVLGAKPLQPDGRAFYYSDYNQNGTKAYFSDTWPCCAGTLPLVAAEYRLLLYFRDPEGIYVNLYLPSVRRPSAKDLECLDRETSMQPSSNAKLERILVWSSRVHHMYNPGRVPHSHRRRKIILRDS